MLDPNELLGESWRSQFFLVSGICLLIWVMFRNGMRARNRMRSQSQELVVQQRKWKDRSESGAPLADAPVDVARWQASMFDLQRELKGELDSKIAVVQAMLRLADEKIELLQSLASESENRGGGENNFGPERELRQ